MCTVATCTGEPQNLNFIPLMFYMRRTTTKLWNESVQTNTDLLATAKPDGGRVSVTAEITSPPLRPSPGVLDSDHPLTDKLVL